MDGGGAPCFLWRRLGQAGSGPCSLWPPPRPQGLAGGWLQGQSPCLGTRVAVAGRDIPSSQGCLRVSPGTVHTRELCDGAARLMRGNYCRH